MSEQSNTDDRLSELKRAIDHYLGVERRGEAARLRIGRALIEAHGLLHHGEWLSWLKANWDWSERTAQRYMELARKGWTVAQIQHVARVTIDDAVADDDLCPDEEPPRERGRKQRKEKRKREKRPLTAAQLSEIMHNFWNAAFFQWGEVMDTLLTCIDDLTPVQAAAYWANKDNFAVWLANHGRQPNADDDEDDIVDVQREPNGDGSRLPPLLLEP